MADDPYRDEDGEPLMDYDDIQSDGGQSLGAHHGAEDHFLDDDIEDGSRTPIYDKAAKPRKRLVKKSGGGGRRDSYDDAPAELLDDYDDH